jgi:hypothetical protein
MAIKTGYTGLYNQSNPSQNLGNLVGFTADNVSNVFIFGRVTNIIYKKEDVDETTWKKLGEYQSLGSIGYVDITQNLQNSNTSPTSQNAQNYAKPAFPFQKYVPCINEIVLIYSLPDQTAQTGNPTKSYYYLGTVNIWNSPHHNANPFSLNINKASGQNKSYASVTAGAVNKTVGNTFSNQVSLGIKESPNISPNQLYPGDYITEGRWGNSIRLGSTVDDKNNLWSKEGKVGSPITIISNGQNENETTKTSYLPVTENINTDLSSIYLTSTQKIPITLPQFLTTSYNSYIPDKPNQFIGSQIVLNSNRLLLASNKDHILLNSALTIGFNSVKGFNFDTPTNFVVNAKTIKLGNKDTTNPMLRGNETVDAIDTIIHHVIKLSTVLSVLIEILPPVPQVAVNIAATDAITALTALKGKLNQPNNLKSTTNFLI